ncbi:hypothetical protein ACWPKO_10305 [Coraliomargarita sp. W4R53]
MNYLRIFLIVIAGGIMLCRGAFTAVIQLNDGTSIEGEFLRLYGADAEIKTPGSDNPRWISLNDMATSSREQIYDPALKETLADSNAIKVDVQMRSRTFSDNYANMYEGFTLFITVKNLSSIHLPVMECQYRSIYEVDSNESPISRKHIIPALPMGASYTIKSAEHEIPIRSNSRHFYRSTTVTFKKSRVPDNEPFDSDRPFYMCLRNQSGKEIPVEVKQVEREDGFVSYKHTLTQTNYRSSFEQLAPESVVELLDWDTKCRIANSLKIDPEINREANPPVKKNGRWKDDWPVLGYHLKITNTTGVKLEDVTIEYALYKERGTWVKSNNERGTQQENAIRGEFQIESLVDDATVELETIGIPVETMQSSGRVNFYDSSKNPNGDTPNSSHMSSVSFKRAREFLLGVRCRVIYKGQVVSEWANREGLIESYSWRIY